MEIGHAEWRVVLRGPLCLFVLGLEQLQRDFFAHNCMELLVKNAVRVFLFLKLDVAKIWVNLLYF